MRIIEDNDDDPAKVYEPQYLQNPQAWRYCQRESQHEAQPARRRSQESDEYYLSMPLTWLC
jgi:hypothetical protein